MNLTMVDKIAKAVLYEGYMLYPYRPSSVKNQQRWNFGVLSPPSYSEAQHGSEASYMQTECLVEGGSLTRLEIRVRFLQLVARSVGRLRIRIPQLPPGEVPEFLPVSGLEVGGRVYQAWQEAVEREVALPMRNLEQLVHAPLSHLFTFPAGKELDYLRDDDGLIAGVVIREQLALDGVVEVKNTQLSPDLFKICVQVRNLTDFGGAEQASREDALLSALVSTHTVLGVEDGRFCSLLDPPDALGEISANCHNVGTWPILMGGAGERDTMLSSPIILYDYPQIAPESAGDLFDGTEIDEILSLRIMTLTEEEKREMRESDERARQMLERTETLPAEQLLKLHGAMRSLRPVEEGTR